MPNDSNLPEPLLAAWSDPVTGLLIAGVARDGTLFGKTLNVNPANAAGLLAALGGAPLAGGQFTGATVPAVVTLTFGASIALDASKGNTFTVTLTSSAGTLANPTHPADGQEIKVRIIQDGTGSRTLAFGSAYDFGAAGAPTLSTGAGKADILIFQYVASLAKWCLLDTAIGF
jgi:hypothetical protein